VRDLAVPQKVKHCGERPRFCLLIDGFARATLPFNGSQFSEGLQVSLAALTESADWCCCSSLLKLLKNAVPGLDREYWLCVAWLRLDRLSGKTKPNVLRSCLQYRR
jgi:hypothetical protein